MSILFILLGSTVFIFLFSTLKIIFQMTGFKRPLMSTTPTLPRVPHIPSQGSSAVSLPVHNINRIMIPSSPQSLAINKQILVNLNIVEYQLVKLKQLLSARDRRRKARQRAAAKDPVDSDSESNQ